MTSSCTWLGRMPGIGTIIKPRIIYLVKAINKNFIYILLMPNYQKKKSIVCNFAKKCVKWYAIKLDELGVQEVLSLFPSITIIPQWSNRRQSRELRLIISQWCSGKHIFRWWRHQMEIFSALLAICTGNSPIESMRLLPIIRIIELHKTNYTAP